MQYGIYILGWLKMNLIKVEKKFVNLSKICQKGGKETMVLHQWCGGKETMVLHWWGGGKETMVLHRWGGGYYKSICFYQLS